MHILQIIDNRKTKNVIREKCIKSVKRFVTDKDTYILKEIEYNQDISSMIHTTDKIRFAFAKEHDDLLYIDTDCFLSALPAEIELKSKKIIMGETATLDGLKPDIFLFYVNNQKNFFLRNYEKLIEKHGEFSVSPKQLQLFADYTPYNPLSYSHHSLTSLEININKHYNSLSQRLVEAEKEINSYRNAIQGMVQTVELYNKLRDKTR
jgi:hypothetical protein